MKKRKGIKYIFISIFIILLIILGVSYISVRNKIYKGEKITFDSPSLNQVEDYKINSNKDEIINILLVGTDKRQPNEVSRADSIIIATIDKKHNKMKFSSILRDTNVNIKGHGEDKINAAYAYGGIGRLTDTIYKNLGIKLNNYVVIDFLGFEKLVDTLGGLEIDVKSYEIKEMNKFIGEVNEIKSPKIEKAGLQILDGQQVLAYTRIRKVGNGVFERTERQRRVMTLIANKLKEMSVFKYPTIVSSLMEGIETNIEPINLIKYGLNVYNMDDLKFEQIQIPSDKYSEGKTYKGSWRILMDKKQNTKLLHEFIYEDN